MKIKLSNKNIDISMISYCCVQKSYFNIIIKGLNDTFICIIIIIMPSH